jgi:REP-associated tyrosine transposase
MPRKPRMFVPGLPAHIIQRGNNRQAIFFKASDYRRYLTLLHEARDRYGCAIHAYVLMTNHVHLLLTPDETTSVSRIMQYVGRKYVPYINLKYGRSGTLWEGRFKASLVQSSRYLLACYRYIELNPVRAGMVRNAVEYAWSSYRCNALGESNELLDPHGIYLGLGITRGNRESSYRQLFSDPIPEEQIRDIREFVQSGTPLGNHKFRDQVEAALSIKIGHARRGRPRLQGGKGL